MLDDVEPSSLYELFDDALAAVETAGVLPSLISPNGYTLIVLDGTQYFCSNKLSCRSAIPSHGELRVKGLFIRACFKLRGLFWYLWVAV